MGLSRLLAVPRTTALLSRRFVATRGKHPVKRAPGKAPHERPLDWNPEAEVKQATGIDKPEQKRGFGDRSNRSESDSPVMGTGAHPTGQQQRAFVWKSATGVQERTVHMSPFEHITVPVDQTPGARAPGQKRTPGEIAATETEESTMVYHPADEEYVNWGRIKPPGEPPDDEDQREAVHEMVKWKRVTQTALVIIALKGAYDLTHIEEEIHRPFLDAPRPRYPYMRIRHKDFPWGPCDLLDLDCWRELKQQPQKEVEALHYRRIEG